MEDLFEELDPCGEIERCVNVCDNVTDLCSTRVRQVSGGRGGGEERRRSYRRYYDGQPIYCEFSPVTDFKESACPAMRGGVLWEGIATFMARNRWDDRCASGCTDDTWGETESTKRSRRARQRSKPR